MCLHLDAAWVPLSYVPRLLTKFYARRISSIQANAISRARVRITSTVRGSSLEDSSVTRAQSKRKPPHFLAHQNFKSRGGEMAWVQSPGSTG